MPKVTAQPYAPGTPATLLFQAVNSDWKRKARLTARPDSTATSRVWVGTTPDVSPGGTNAATDGIYLDPSEIWSDDLVMGDKWYVVVATGAPTTDVYYQVSGSK